MILTGSDIRGSIRLRSGIRVPIVETVPNPAHRFRAAQHSSAALGVADRDAVSPMALAGLTMNAQTAATPAYALPVVVTRRSGV